MKTKQGFVLENASNAKIKEVINGVYDNVCYGKGDVVELWGRLESTDFGGRVNYFYIQIDAPFLPDYRVRG